MDIGQVLKQVDEIKSPILLLETEFPYDKYFEVKKAIGKKKSILTYDSFFGGHYPNAADSKSKILIPSIEETIKHFYTASDLKLCILCVNDNELSSNVVDLLDYYHSAPKPESKKILLITKSGKQIYYISTTLSRSNKLRYLTKLPVRSDIIGLDKLEGWLESRKVLLTGNHPIGLKGISILGIAGTGKTMSAQLAAHTFGLPLYKFNLHSCLGKYVGDSEANTEYAFREIDTLGHCVILLDEVDKIFNVNDDNQTTSRVLSIMLSYMDSNRKVFWVLTGNNIKHIPPELLRKGRLDEYFYIGLPNNMTSLQYISNRLNEFCSYINIEDIDDQIILLHSAVKAKNLTFSDIVSMCDEYYVCCRNNKSSSAQLFLNYWKPISSYDRYKDDYDAILKWSEQNAKSAI